MIVRQGSQFGIYDEYAVNAIKLASPFPPVPDEMSKKGIPILARFNYVLESTRSPTSSAEMPAVTGPCLDTRAPSRVA